MAEEPPPAALGQLADLGTGQGQHVGRHLAQRARGEGERAGEVGDRGAQGVPGQRGFGQAQFARVGRRRASRPTAAAWRCSLPPRTPEGRQGARRAAQLGGERAAHRPQPVPRVEHQRAPAGGLEAEGRRHRVLGQGAARHRRVPVGGASRASASAVRARSAEDEVQGAGRHQHHRRVQDVLAGRAPVDVGRARPRGHRRRQVGDQRDHRVPAGPRPQRQLPYVEAVGPRPPR